MKNKSRIFNSKNALKSITEFLSKELHESGVHALLGLEIQPRYEAPGDLWVKNVKNAVINIR